MLSHSQQWSQAGRWKASQCLNWTQLLAKLLCMKFTSKDFLLWVSHLLFLTFLASCRLFWVCFIQLLWKVKFKSIRFLLSAQPFHIAQEPYSSSFSIQPLISCLSVLPHERRSTFNFHDLNGCNDRDGAHNTSQENTELLVKFPQEVMISVSDRELCTMQCWQKQTEMQIVICFLEC